MGTKELRQLPPDLVRGQSRFRTWRAQRKAGVRIPQPLWALAIRLAKTHGVSRTSAALGLDYHSLKERADGVPNLTRRPEARPRTAPGLVADPERILRNRAGETKGKV